MTKYHNKKVMYDGQVFDSRREFVRWCELVLLEKAGQVTDLKRQVKFELIPSQKIDGKVVERACSYIADFVYKDDKGKLHVEDVKGYKGGGAYAVFTIKRKLMMYNYGIKISEV